MAKYKCPTLGDCDKANSAEIFERAPGENLKCPQCNTLMELQDTGVLGTSNTTRSNSLQKLVLGAVALVVLSAGGFIFWQSQHKPRETVSAPAIAPAIVAVAPSASAVVIPSESTVAKGTIGIPPSDAETKALRMQSDASLVAGKSQEAEAISSKAASNELLKAAIAKMSQGKLDEAERELNEARLRSPEQTLIPYNMAILRLKQNRVDDALRELEISFKGGFNYYDQMDKDSDLDGLRTNPRFTALVTQYRPISK